MKKLKVILCALLAVLVIASPFATVLGIAFFAPAQYQNTFVGALDDKFERLNSIEEPKIVIVGGSSVAFGIDSALLEKYMDMPVVNFGLYASLGTKLMLDLSRSGIGEGDIVIVAPEINSQTYSLYFNTDTTLKALDGSFHMAKYIPREHRSSLLGGLWNLASGKAGYMLSGAPANPDGAYNSKYFDEYGDFDYGRKENIMLDYYDINTMIDPDPEIITDEFADYVNDYVDYCESQGAKVYFAFPPMNRLGVVDGKTEEDFCIFADAVEEKIKAKIINMDINSCIYEPGYFYDTNFHLNDAGRLMHTLNLLTDMMFEFNIFELPEEEIPDPPKLPNIDVRWDGECEGTEYFTFEKANNGAYMITGLTELGKKQKTLTVPLGYDGYKVMYVGEAAFSGSELTTLVITEDTNIRAFRPGAFSGAKRLSAMWLHYPTPQDILPPPDFYGVARDFVVHVPVDSHYDDGGYYWGERGLTFVKDIE